MMSSPYLLYRHHCYHTIPSCNFITSFNHPTTKAPSSLSLILSPTKKKKKKKRRPKAKRKLSHHDFERPAETLAQLGYSYYLSHSLVRESERV
ncbi:hypothetical protein C1H46_042458 [Malus baccata]|uniref:Uncharacterized protein n=1 Tax=Malus baccata TaxID=106549 RepID=A0A540KCQ8_MALBA|nr:hypothetical protein C1H46_042458 [Malus baccata]